MQSVEGDDSLAEIQKTSAIVEPVFIQGLKQVINEITSGKLKLKIIMFNKFLKIVITLYVISTIDKL